MTAQYVTDGRPGVFWMHDAIYDHYAPRIGVYGIAVYGMLCRRANAEKHCWPSLNRMAKDLGISRPTVVSALDTLQKEGLISRRQREEEGKGHISTSYTLLYPDTLVNDINKPCQYGEQALVNEVDIKEYTKEGIHKEGGERARARGEVRYLDDACREMVYELMSVENWDKSESKTIAYVADTLKTYPDVDLLELAKTFAYKLRNGLVKSYKKPSQAFGRWASAENKRSVEKKPESASPENLVQALEEYDRDGVTDLRRLAPIARKCDLTASEDTISYPLKLAISPDDEERRTLLSRVRSLYVKVQRGIA